jgi:hypothetical protein|tara:strand:- start:1073 stop:1183 length:111 start_codon:yes stop_codon:yes gene_type:complete
MKVPNIATLTVKLTMYLQIKYGPYFGIKKLYIAGNG